MSNPKILTANQLLVLAHAAQRPNHVVLPLPPAMRVRGGAQRNILASLLKLGLVQELAVENATDAVRTDDAGQHMGLRLTAAGLAAAGVSSEAAHPAEVVQNEATPVDGSQATGSESTDDTAPAPNGASDVPALPRRPTGKLGAVLQAVSADTGATLSEIVSLTGWLPHTARAAVTGLRQRGFGIHLITQDDRKAYRLTDAG